MNGYSRIVRVVVAHTGINRAYIMSQRRQRPVAHARALAMYLAYYVCCRASSGTIALYFARDHTTVLTAIKKIEKAMRHNEDFAEEVRALRRGLEA